jgi:SAM-dependent methyltransferase
LADPRSATLDGHWDRHGDTDWPDVSLNRISGLSERIKRRVARELAVRARGSVTPPADARRYDSWLRAFCAAELDPIEAACASAGPEALARFSDLDSDLWALLLTQEYDAYPHIRRVLPSVPDPALQETWNGASGLVLAAQSRGFYDKVRWRYSLHSQRDLRGSSVLDFGCGWGRLTRFFARDVQPGRLFGCDPVQPILDVCERCGVPAILRRCEFVPDALPFDQTFDLVYAFSVFTHLSEPAHEASLRALHACLHPGGLLFVTIRPPEYLSLSELLRPALASLGPRPQEQLQRSQYLFAAHGGQPLGAEAPGGEVTYGETVITLPYVRERWRERFELLNVDLLLGDPYQVLLTLRRNRSEPAL